MYLGQKEIPLGQKEIPLEQKEMYLRQKEIPLGQKEMHLRQKERIYSISCASIVFRLLVRGDLKYDLHLQEIKRHLMALISLKKGVYAP